MLRSIGGIRALVGACSCAEGACDYCKSTCSRDPAPSPGFDALAAAAHNSRHAAPRSPAGTPPRAGCAAAARSSPLWWPCHNISSRMAHGVCLLTPLRPAAGDRAGAGAAHQAAMLSLLNYDPRRHSPGPKAAHRSCNDGPALPASGYRRSSYPLVGPAVKTVRVRTIVQTGIACFGQHGASSSAAAGDATTSTTGASAVTYFSFSKIGPKLTAHCPRDCSAPE